VEERIQEWLLVGREVVGSYHLAVLDLIRIRVQCRTNFDYAWASPCDEVLSLVLSSSLRLEPHSEFRSGSHLKSLKSRRRSRLLCFHFCHRRSCP